jgi:hypothetical protein
MSKKQEFTGEAPSKRALVGNVTEPGVGLAQTGEVMPIRLGEEFSVSASGTEFAPSIRYVIANGAAYLTSDLPTHGAANDIVDSGGGKSPGRNVAKVYYGALMGNIRRITRAKSSVAPSPRIVVDGLREVASD